MKSSINKTTLQELTRLPLSVVELTNSMFPDIHVNTPHKGTVIIKLKQKHYPFLFGSVTQTDKDSGEVLREIYKLEHEACDYLIEQWKLSEIKKI